MAEFTYLIAIGYLRDAHLVPRGNIVAKPDLTVSDRDRFPLDEVATGDSHIVFGPQDD